MTPQMNKTTSIRVWLPRMLLPVIAATLAACATTSTPKKVVQAEEAPESSSRTEVDELVGFTIVEEGKITADVRTQYAEALRLIEAGDRDRGMDILEAIAAEAPYLSAPLVDLGIEQHKAGDHAAAEQSLKRAIEAAPEHPVAHNELGIVYRKMGRLNDARRHYEIALEIYPGYHFARRNLAVLCDLYLDDLDCALENYDAYLFMVPDDAEAEMWVTDVRMRIDQGE
jgi:Flp pilus assembly protein TadD